MRKPIDACFIKAPATYESKVTKINFPCHRHLDGFIYGCEKIRENIMNKHKPEVLPHLFFKINANGELIETRPGAILDSYESAVLWSREPQSVPKLHDFDSNSELAGFEAAIKHLAGDICYFVPDDDYRLVDHDTFFMWGEGDIRKHVAQFKFDNPSVKVFANPNGDCVTSLWEVGDMVHKMATVESE